MVADTKAPASCTRALSWALASVVPAIAVSAHVRGASVVAKAAGAAVHRCQPRPACLLATAHRQRPGGAVPQRWWWCWHDGALRCPHLRRQGSTAQTGYGVLQGSAGRCDPACFPRCYSRQHDCAPPCWWSAVVPEIGPRDAATWLRRSGCWRRSERRASAR